MAASSLQYSKVMTTHWLTKVVLRLASRIEMSLFEIVGML
jgi:hypothetical protein